MTSTAVAKASPKAVLRKNLEAARDQFAALLPSTVNPDTVISAALVAASHNPDIFNCTPASVALAVARISQWGLVPGVTAHIVPFGQQATAVADYKGLIALMVQAGAKGVESRVVREGDEFSYEYGLTPSLIHRPRALSDAPIIAAYAILRLRTGAEPFEVMSAEEIDAIRQAKSRSWKKGPIPEWYARKTVIRRLAKYVPKVSDQLARVLREDDGEGEDLPEATAALLTEIPADTPHPQVQFGDHEPGAEMPRVDAQEIEEDPFDDR